MRILVDTNVVLDLLLDRKPWSDAATALFSEVESGAVEAYLCATTLTTLYYLTSKKVGALAARREIDMLMTLCSVAPVNKLVLEAALGAAFPDYEDGVIYAAARLAAVEAIITRDPKDFASAKLPILTAEECLKILAQRRRPAAETAEG